MNKYQYIIYTIKHPFCVETTVLLSQCLQNIRIVKVARKNDRLAYGTAVSYSNQIIFLQCNYKNELFLNNILIISS